MTTGLIIDDHPITHLGCRRLLQEAGVDEVLTARSAEDGYSLASQHQPTLIVLDLGLPGVGGLAMIGRLLEKTPGVRILIFSMHDDPIFAARALEAGAHGYLSKTVKPEEFIAAINALRAGKVYLEHGIATRLAVLHSGRSQHPLVALSARELQVLRLIGQGRRHSAIAEQLNLSYKTVANTSSLLKSKLGAKTLADLIRIAIENSESTV